MAFTFPILLGGLALVSVPILLHFLLRQQPKILPFPAFRFLVKRHKTNLTRLRLRHLLLLLLRMALLAALCLALARPRMKADPWALHSDQPALAVFVFDTSPSMEYTLPGGQSRLKDAQKRAFEMLKLLPDGSEVLVLDSADAAPLGKGDWLSREKAADRIGHLQMAAANGPVTVRLAAGLELLRAVAGSRGDDDRGRRPRVVCIFSDRTTASWDIRERKSLQSIANQVAPTFEILQAVRTGLGALAKLVAEVPARLPGVAQAFAHQPLLDAIGKVSERIEQTRSVDYPDEAIQDLLARVRGKEQELLALLEKQTVGDSTEARDYRDKLIASLRASLRDSAGFRGFYVDVGIEQPADLAVVDLELAPVQDDNRQLKWRILATAQATGDRFPAALLLDAGAHKPKRVELELRAGDRETVPFDVAQTALAAPFHQFKLVAEPTDQLAIDNIRFLTVARRRLLVLYDALPAQQLEAKTWAAALEANRFGAARYACDIKAVDGYVEPPPGAFDEYAAIFLCGLKSPQPALWQRLSEFVGRGGGLFVAAGAEDMNKEAYNAVKPAQEILPATFDQTVSSSSVGPDWDWPTALYDHPLMHPYKDWRLANKWDLFVGRGAAKYWQVKPHKGAAVLVAYADDNHRPALLERTVEGKQNRGRAGRVLLVTTPPGWAGWNNYRDDGNSFYLTLARQVLGRLTGDADRPSLNFLSGKKLPQVPVPIRGQTTTYKLYRDTGPIPASYVGDVTVEAEQNEARIPLARAPGNYTLRPPGGADASVWFSVNLAAEEIDLKRIDAEEIDAVLGPDALLKPGATANLSESMQGQISRPWELMPMLMLAVLLGLALENLVANRFYRDRPSGEGKT
jgi:hypothetical protein